MWMCAAQSTVRFKRNKDMAKEVIGKGWITVAAINDGKPGSPGSPGSPGKPGSDGKDALTVSVSPEVIVLHAVKVSDSNYNVKNFSTAQARIAVFRGGTNVSPQCALSDVKQQYCRAAASGLTISITSVSQNVVDGMRIPYTDARVTATVNYVENGNIERLYVTIVVKVEVSALWGRIEKSLSGLSSKYTELSNTVNGLPLKDDASLTKYTSEIKQTAREIALKVGQTAVGRKNLLVGSALCRQGKGVVMTIGGESGIERLGGVDDVNCWHGVAAAQETVTLGMDAAAGGYNVRVENGKKYTMSAWVKVTDARAVVFYRVGFRASADSTTDVNTLTDHVLTSAEKTSAWQLVTWTWEMPQSVSESYARVLFGMTNGTAGTTMGVWICQPMLQEGDGYTGWCLSEQDYKYVGGNMLDNTRTLEKRGNMVTRNGTVTAEGYGGCATIEATAGPDYIDMLQWQCKDEFALNEDYTLSFMAKGSGRISGYMYHGTGIRMRCENSDGLSRTDVSDGSSAVTLTSEWRRYWIHWRNKGTGKAEYMLLRLLSGGTATIAQPKLEVGANVTDWLEGSATLTEDRSVEARLLDTGIDIKNKTIDMTADKFTLRNNHGEKSFDVDEDGNLEARSLKSVSKDGLLTAVIKDGAFNAKNAMSGASAFFGLVDGLPYLQFTNAAGVVTYAIGATGGRAFGVVKLSLTACNMWLSVADNPVSSDSWLITYGGTITLKNLGQETLSVYKSKLIATIDGFSKKLTPTPSNDSFTMGVTGTNDKMSSVFPGAELVVNFTTITETVKKKNNDGSYNAKPSGYRSVAVVYNNEKIGNGVVK